MLKKIFCAMLLCVAIVFVGNETFAQDVWIAGYSSRVECYVMTETFINRTQYRANRAFSVNVKFVGASVAVHEYSFRENDGLVWFSVDGGADDFADNDALAKKIWEFGLKFFGIDYEVSYR